MHNINEIITNNFHQNINYLEAYHPTLFSKLSDYDSAVSHGHYIERYELVYENDNFDVLEKQTNKYLYQKESTQFATLAAKSIEYSGLENTFEGCESVEISEHQMQEYTHKDPFSHHMSGFAPIINFTQKNSPQTIKLKKLFKYIFFGTGLGLHLSTIAQKIQADIYLIVEDDLELFRLSLFTTNYAELAQNSKLIFSVFEDQNEFVATSELFLKEQYYHNHYIKFFQMLSHSDEKRTNFHVAVGSQSHQLFFYHHLLIQYLQPLEYMFDNYKFLNKSLDFSQLSSEKKPFLLLAAGPSLQKNIKWVQNNQQNFIIVALSATLSLLEKHQIIPDIITHLDGFEAASLHFTKLQNIKTFQNALCFFSDRTSQEVLSFFPKENIYFFENGTRYKEDSLKPSAPCVGSLTFQLLLSLKVKSFYLLGLDLAIDSKTGATHSSEHSYSQTLNVAKKLMQETTITYKESLFEVAGNTQPIVLTTSHFKSSIDTINLSSKLLKQGFQTIYNLSDGAEFLNVEVKNILNVHIDSWKKTKTLQKIHQLINKAPLKEFTHKESKTLKNRYKKAQNFKNILLTYEKENFSNTQEFLDSLKQLIGELTHEKLFKEFELSRVFDTYLRYILPHIFNFFNQEGITKEPLAIKKLHHFLITHLLQIVAHYMQNLNKYQTKGPK